MRSARMPPELYNSRRSFSLNKLVRSVFYNQPIFEPEADWMFVPFSQSRMWFFHMATTRSATY